MKLKQSVTISLSIVIATAAGLAWYVRAQTWPCGDFETDSGCISSVKLQTDELGFEPGLIKVARKSFDLASNAEFMVVGLNGIREEQNAQGKTEKRNYAVLALFDVQDGSLIRVLRELKGSEYRSKNDFFRGASTEEIALSQDGSLVASYAFGENQNSLIVQRTADGSLVKTIYEIDTHRVYDCTGMLDFSDDNQSLQCFSTLYQLDSGQTKQLSKDGNYIFPFLADFAAGSTATAPDGTKVESGNLLNIILAKKPLTREEVEAEVKRYYDNNFTLIKVDSEPQLIGSPLDLFDSRRDFVFSPHSQYFIEAYKAYHKARGDRRFVPPPFRRLSAVAIWTRDGELKRMFFTNKRYGSIAWSRDGDYFALINQDLTLQVFNVSKKVSITWD